MINIYQHKYEWVEWLFNKKEAHLQIYQQQNRNFVRVGQRQGWPLKVKLSVCRWGEAPSYSYSCIFSGDTVFCDHAVVSLRSATNASVKTLGTLRYNQLARNSSNLRNVRLEWLEKGWVTITMAVHRRSFKRDRDLYPNHCWCRLRNRITWSSEGKAWT